MSETTILIIIDDEGISIEGVGFEGHGCAGEVSKISKKLGVRGKLEKKPDYHRHHSSSSKLEQQLTQ